MFTKCITPIKFRVALDMIKIKTMVDDVRSPPKTPAKPSTSPTTAAFATNKKKAYGDDWL